MNADVSVRVENLGKLYRIGEREPYKTLRDSLARPFRNRQHLGSSEKRDQYVWALKGVSFKISRGEVVGIIGSNAAGKSTLLKILSRITEPTEGYAEVFGRVGSLLEIGTGFHQELTGRDNVYLSGAILGMRKREIEDKFEDIVEFAGIEKFISTPVKYYSSGMYVRLAFAVAAHLEPEILLVDEVLAVGDAAFQKKCLGKMGQVAREGRTVLFVSHNMAAIEALCKSCILLHHGEIQAEGQPSQVIRYYLDKVFSSSSAIPLRERKDRTGSGRIRLTGFHLEDVSTGKRIEAVQSGQDCVFVFDYECADRTSPRSVDVGFSVSDQLGRPLFVLYTSFVGAAFDTVPAKGQFRCRIGRLPLASGQYAVGARVVIGNEEADYPGVVALLSVEDGDFFRSGRTGLKGHSPFLVDGQWIVTENR